jgi:hypothetical protein
MEKHIGKPVKERFADVTIRASRFLTDYSSAFRQKKMSGIYGLYGPSFRATNLILVGSFANTTA